MANNMTYELDIEHDFGALENVLTTQFSSLGSALKELVDNSAEYGATNIRIYVENDQVVVTDNGKGVGDDVTNMANLVRVKPTSHNSANINRHLGKYGQGCNSSVRYIGKVGEAINRTSSGDFYRLTYAGLSRKCYPEVVTKNENPEEYKELLKIWEEYNPTAQTGLLWRITKLNVDGRDTNEAGIRKINTDLAVTYGIGIAKEGVNLYLNKNKIEYIDVRGEEITEPLPELTEDKKEKTS